MVPPEMQPVARRSTRDYGTLNRIPSCPVTQDFAFSGVRNAPGLDLFFGIFRIQQDL
jgi:hypothetical protein